MSGRCSWPRFNVCRAAGGRVGNGTDDPSPPETLIQWDEWTDPRRPKYSSRLMRKPPIRQPTSRVATLICFESIWSPGAKLICCFRGPGASGQSLELLLLQPLGGAVAAQVDAGDAAAAHLGGRAQPRHPGHRQGHQVRREGEPLVCHPQG